MTRRVPALDGLRGLAVLLVAIHHSAPPPATLPGAGWMMSVLLSGWIGVDLFMVLSGFLITTRLLEHRDRPDFFGWFYANRALRILPAYYTLLLTLLALTTVLGLDWHGRQFLLLTFTQNVGIASALTFDVGVSLRHLWSVSLEEHFYLLWPLLVFLLPTARRLATAAVAISVAALGLRLLALRYQWPLGDIYTMTPFRIDTLLAGALLAIAWRRDGAAAGLTRAAPVAFVIAATAAVLVARTGHAFRWDSAVMAAFGYNLIALVFVCLVVLALTPGSICTRALSMSWLRFLGKYSYGIYLIFLPISDAADPFRNWIHTVSGHHPLDFLVSNAAVMALAIGLAMASYHVIEQPFLRLKPRLAG